MLPTYTNVNLHDDAARNEEFVLEFRLNLRCKSLTRIIFVNAFKKVKIN